jgi:hypothetical protein
LSGELSYLFCFAFSTQVDPDIVIAIAKDVGDSSKNGITRNENQIDEELTI